MSEFSIRQFLEQSDIFQGLDDSVLDQLSSELELIRLQPSEILLNFGDEADCLYIVASGELKVTLPTDVGERIGIDTSQPGDVIGEIAFLTRQTRSATITATRPTIVLKLSRYCFSILEDSAPSAVEAISEKSRQRSRYNQLANGLFRVFGRSISQELVQTIAREVEWLTLPSGAPLFHQGDISDAMYFVVGGLLRQVTTDQLGVETVHREVAPGDTVGLILMLTGSRRDTTAYAIRVSTVIRLSKELFERMTRTVPEISLPIMRLLSQAAAGALGRTARDQPAALTYALVPLHAEVPIVEFGHQLEESLAPQKTLYLDAARVNQQFGDIDAAHAPAETPLYAALATWINDQQISHTHVLLVTGPIWTHWSQNCIQFADRIILVGLNGQDGRWQRTPLEKLIAQKVPHTRTELVLLHHPETAVPQGTSRWLEHRQLHTYHHVRLGEKRHYRRLARRLSGRAVGLVLGGGGARGFGHVGVTRALEEAGLEIDWVGASSMGAIVGGVYAYEASYEEMCQMARTLGNNNRIFDRTLPFVALNRSRNVTQVLKDLYRGKSFEDAWRPFFCTASSLTRAQLKVIEAGDLALGVRASSAIPGVFTPVARGNELLVDGGLMNNFPVDIMRQKVDSGTVIGVKVSPTVENTVDYEMGTDVSGWDVLWRRASPFAQKHPWPSLVATLMRSLEINSLDQIRNAKTMADFIIELELRDFSSLNFDKHAEIIEASYETACRRIEEWLQQTNEARPGQP